MIKSDGIEWIERIEEEVIGLVVVRNWMVGMSWWVNVEHPELLVLSGSWCIIYRQNARRTTESNSIYAKEGFDDGKRSLFSFARSAMVGLIEQRICGLAKVGECQVEYLNRRSSSSRTIEEARKLLIDTVGEDERWNAKLVDLWEVSGGGDLVVFSMML